MTALAVTRFDRAAACYDSAAAFQVEIAAQLVARALPSYPPRSILDIGCGTGLVAQAAQRRWPAARLTALDAAPAMLRQAQARLPGLQALTGDAAQIELGERFDLIVSSMMLHWLPDPVAALRRWQGWLQPGGTLQVALLVAGSFAEWRQLCAEQALPSGLWPLPPADFATALNPQVERADRQINFPAALAFLRQLKRTGAATAAARYAPLSGPALRRLLAAAPRPFTITYRSLFLTLPAVAAAVTTQGDKPAFFSAKHAN